MALSPSSARDPRKANLGIDIYQEITACEWGIDGVVRYRFAIDRASVSAPA